MNTPPEMSEPTKQFTTPGNDSNGVNALSGSIVSIANDNVEYNMCFLMVESFNLKISESIIVTTLLIYTAILFCFSGLRHTKYDLSKKCPIDKTYLSFWIFENLFIR